MLIISRLCLGLGIGMLPGAAMFIAGAREQGVGLMILGAVIGLAVAFASVLYRTSGKNVLRRSFRMFSKLMLRKNLPGCEHLVPLPDEHVPPRFRARHADWQVLDSRLSRGSVWGWMAMLVPAVLIVLNLPEDQPHRPIWLRIMRDIVLVLVITMYGGWVLGSAVASFTLRGAHRSHMLAGLIAGAILGLGLGIAVAPGARIGVVGMIAFCCGLFSVLGLTVGLCAGLKAAKEHADVAARQSESTEVDAAASIRTGDAP